MWRGRSGGRTKGGMGRIENLDKQYERGIIHEKGIFRSSRRIWYCVGRLLHRLFSPIYHHSVHFRTSSPNQTIFPSISCVLLFSQNSRPLRRKYRFRETPCSILVLWCNVVNSLTERNDSWFGNALLYCSELVYRVYTYTGLIQQKSYIPDTWRGQGQDVMPVDSAMLFYVYCLELVYRVYMYSYTGLIQQKSYIPDTWRGQGQEKNLYADRNFLEENAHSALKGTVSLFWPRVPEIALTFLRNEFIVKL